MVFAGGEEGDAADAEEEGDGFGVAVRAVGMREADPQAGVVEAVFSVLLPEQGERLLRAEVKRRD